VRFRAPLHLHRYDVNKLCTKLFLKNLSFYPFFYFIAKAVAQQKQSIGQLFLHKIKASDKYNKVNSINYFWGENTAKNGIPLLQ
jgi:hypothetical protein